MIRKSRAAATALRFAALIGAAAVAASPATFAVGPQSEEAGGTVETAPTSSSERAPVLFHVKTALSVDDAQICAVPNVAWAALEDGNEVILLFDGSAVTSITRGFGWRGWLGISSTAMERAALPERERRSLAEQFDVPLDSVPSDYGEYLGFLQERGARLYYNRTMALLYRIEPESVDPAVEPLGLKEMARLLTSPKIYLVY